MLNLKILILISLITIITAATSKSSDDLYSARKQTKVIDKFQRSDAILSRREVQVEDIFLQHKHAELLNDFEYSYKNLAEMHFFHAKPFIERSKVFKFLQKMPKGALLNTDSSASVSSKWVVQNIFYMEGLMSCENEYGQNIFTFRYQPQKHGCTTPYVYIVEERKHAFSRLQYDFALERLINLYTLQPELKYDSKAKVWYTFQVMFEAISDALLYIPAFRLYHRQMLEELYKDNIMYAEVRLGFKPMYDSKGNILPIEHNVVELIEIEREFKREHPDFLGIKIIYSADHNAEPNAILKHLEQFRNLRFLFPKYIVGFNLVRKAELGNPVYNLPDILKYKPNSTNFFFDAGEINWNETASISNQIDAVLVNTTRITHSNALMNHPVLLKAIKTRDIAVEVSPLSIQMLDLVSDLRNQPGDFYILQNIPMVICNDSPGFWNAKALSYDFYYTIMSLAPKNGGLNILKQMVWNSIEYSLLPPDDKRKAFHLLQQQWEHFLCDVLNREDQKNKAHTKNSLATRYKLSHQRPIFLKNRLFDKVFKNKFSHQYANNRRISLQFKF